MDLGLGLPQTAKHLVGTLAHRRRQTGTSYKAPNLAQASVLVFRSIRALGDAAVIKTVFMVVLRISVMVAREALRGVGMG
jgi:hypothetical protein